MRKINDRIVKIEGMDTHPINRGGICPLGVSGPQLLYGPNRVKTPLKRKGKRGENSWEPISWDDAIAEVADRISALESEKKQDGLACICDTDQGTIPQLFKRFLALIGSPNFMTTPSMNDSFTSLFRSLHGMADNPNVGFDVENADFILSFGCGVIEGWGAPVRMIKANSQWKSSKAKLIQIEQRLSNTAASSNRFLAVTPGTEADLALGMMCVILEEELYNKAFTGAYSTGFQDFRNMVTRYYNPDDVSKKTGMERHLIIELARRFVSAKAPLALCGKGKGQTAGNMREFMAVHCLNALAGRINMPGGVWTVDAPDYITWAKDTAPTEKIHGKERVDQAGSASFPDSASLLSRLPARILESPESPVKVLFVNQANPCHTLSGTTRVLEAFQRIPYIVSFSSYMDETAAQADLILPNHTYLERYQDVPVKAGLSCPVIGLTRPVVEPQYDTKHCGDVLITLAGLVGGDVADGFPWSDYESCLKDTLADTWDDLDNNGFWTDDGYKPKTWDETFGGVYRKFAFPASLPAAQEIEGDAKTYPLILVPKESLRAASGYIADTPFVLKTVPDTELKGNKLVVEINPQTAKSLGLADGKLAVLKTPAGKATVQVGFCDGIMPGLVAMPKGFGHTAMGKYLKNRGTNYNALVNPVEDPVSGQDTVWAIRAAMKQA